MTGWEDDPHQPPHEIQRVVKAAVLGYNRNGNFVRASDVFDTWKKTRESWWNVALKLLEKQ